jgi:hypothetical protein
MEKDWNEQDESLDFGHSKLYFWKEFDHYFTSSEIVQKFIFHLISTIMNITQAM